MSLYQKYLSTIKKWIWKPVDFDWYYANQCVDWAKMYAKDLWYPITTSWNAKDFVKKWLGKNWVRVTWEAWVWDIGIQPRWTYWHIFVVESIKNGTLYVIEQNRDARAYMNNNSRNLGSPVSSGKYQIKWDEVYFRVAIPNK